ncbi:MAG: DNA/RNA non-specific endonuclease, partial [Pseudomonadota bacterium]
MVDLFISYKREDQDHARRLAEALQRDRGWHCWWDAALVSSEVFSISIEKELSKADLVLVLWSERAVASTFVIAEASRALELGKLVPVRIAPVSPPVPFNSLHTLDLVEWDGSASSPAYNALLGDLDERVRALGNHQAPALATPVDDRGSPSTPTRRSSPIRWVAALLSTMLAAASAWYWWPESDVTPMLLAPPDQAIFSHVPRTLQFRWAAVPGATAYYVQIQGQDPQTRTWFDHPGQSIVSTQNTTIGFEFVGSQPGRWRVGTLAADGARGTPSAWRGFLFDDAPLVEGLTIEGVPVIPYDEAFLGEGHVVPIPVPKDRALAASFAQGEVIDYLHYSLLINQQRSMAAVVAINMDRAATLSLRREAVDFIVDPRLPRAIQRDNFLYQNNGWDRGHLVAPAFIAWGDGKVDAPIAYQQAVSFYSATAPQHANFNRTTWLSIERYFQEGFAPTAQRIVVFAGPV